MDFDASLLLLMLLQCRNRDWQRWRRLRSTLVRWHGCLDPARYVPQRLYRKRGQEKLRLSVGLNLSFLFSLLSSLFSLSLSLVCSVFSGRSRPPMTPVFSIMSSFLYFVIFHVMLFIQSIIISLCLPRVLVPSILPSKTVRRRDSLLNTWPNQFFCLCRMVFKLLFYPPCPKPID